jgi:hypothetical protein
MAKDNKFDYMIVLRYAAGYLFAVFFFDVVNMEKNIVNLILIFIIYLISSSIVEKIIEILKKRLKK